MSQKLRAFIFNRITIALAIFALMIAPQIVVAQSCKKEGKAPVVYSIPGVTSAMRLRANEFKNAIETRAELNLRSSVYIYASTTIKKYIDNPKDLVDKLVILGFTDVYLSYVEQPHSLNIPKKEMGTLALSQALGFFFQHPYDTGLLLWGGAQQFLQHCDHVVVMAYNYQAKRVIETATPVLTAASQYPKSVSIAIKTSLNTVGGDGPLTSFQPQGWDNLISSLKYILTEAKKFNTFRGIDLFEFNGLEIMWESK